MKIERIAHRAASGHDFFQEISEPGKHLNWYPLTCKLPAPFTCNLTFTSLAHYLTVEALGRAFRRLRRSASAGLDGMTVAEYEQGLDGRLEGLHERLKAGQYRAQPVRRHWIPKADGKMRPLGIPCLEDKLVQSAVAEILGAIYEADFMGFSYGFRENRGPHDALNALQTALQHGKVNWVLDADIRSFFDTIDCGFRGIARTDSTASRAWIPRHPAQGFRGMARTYGELTRRWVTGCTGHRLGGVYGNSEVTHANDS